MKTELVFLLAQAVCGAFAYHKHAPRASRPENVPAAVHAMITPPPRAHPELHRRGYPLSQTMTVCNGGKNCHTFTVTRPKETTQRLQHHGEDPDFVITVRPFIFPPTTSIDVTEEVTAVSLTTATSYHTMPATTDSSGKVFGAILVAEIVVAVAAYGLLHPEPIIIEIPEEGIEEEEADPPQEPDESPTHWSTITTSQPPEDTDVCSLDSVEWNSGFMSGFNSEVTSLGSSGLSSVYSRPPTFGVTSQPPTTTPPTPPPTSTTPLYKTTQVICDSLSGPDEDGWNRGHELTNIKYLENLGKGNADCDIKEKGTGEFSCSYNEAVDIVNLGGAVSLKCKDVAALAMKVYNACPGIGTMNIGGTSYYISLGNRKC